MHTRLGKVADWRDDRGYGFVVPVERGDGPERLFFHIDDYTQAGRRPERGELVRYVASRQADGRWRAQAVVRTTPASARPRAGRRRPPGGSRVTTGTGATGRVPIIVLLTVWLALLLPAVVSGALPGWVLPALLALNLLTWALYAFDKRAAQAGRWRTPEAHLHLCELLGGWPAAWLAQRQLRHKSAKRAYRAIYWSMAVLHVAAIALWRAA